MPKRIINSLQHSWIVRYVKRWWPVVAAVVAVLGVLSTVITIAGAQGVMGLVDTVWPGEHSSSAEHSLEDPIRIDSELNTSVFTYGEIPVGVIEDFDPNKGVSYYNRKNRIAYSFPVINIDVVCQVDDEWIKLAPYLVVELTDIESVPDNVYFVAPAPQGGSGAMDAFGVTLSPDRDKIFGAPQKATTFDQRDFDYFTLQPGEREGSSLLAPVNV